MIALAWMSLLQGVPAGPPPAPVEDGLQPPMTFACRLDGPAGRAEVSGRISRFWMKVAPNAGLFVISEPGGYRDHVVVEIESSSLEGLAGRYDIEARFPDTGEMIMALPGQAGRAGYTLAASPARFGIGYQAFTRLRAERSGSPAVSWAGPCTTKLPQPGRKKP